jgi:hypothetical protein
MSRPGARGLTYPTADEPVTRRKLRLFRGAHIAGVLAHNVRLTRVTGLVWLLVRITGAAAGWLSSAGGRRVDGVAGAAYGGVREAWMPAQHG